MPRPRQPARGTHDVVGVVLLAGAMVPMVMVSSHALRLSAETEEVPEIALTVRVTHEGHLIEGADHVLGRFSGATVPCQRDGCPTPLDYDWEALAITLAQVEAVHPRVLSVEVVPEVGTRYDVLMKTTSLAQARQWPPARIGSPPRQ